MILGSLGFIDIDIKTYMTGTSDGQSKNETVWCVKALKKDARGDIKLDFFEAGFDLFIHNLISIVLPNLRVYN